jgi:hypothetical protein
MSDANPAGMGLSYAPPIEKGPQEPHTLSRTTLHPPWRDLKLLDFSCGL